MADQTRTSNRKRTIKSEQKPLAKRQKRAKCEMSSNNKAALAPAPAPVPSQAPEPESAPITNICNELIDRIFDFLDVASLLNVAGTCKRLQIAAAAKIDHKLCDKRIFLIEAPIMPQGISSYRDDILVAGLKFSLPFLRCFGAKIRSLKVSREHEIPVEQKMHLYRYIQQYCADTVATLHVDNMDKPFPAEIFAKPFKNVQKIEIVCGHLGNLLPKFANWFPNLRSLDMYCIRSIDGSATAVSFPHLEYLAVDLTSSSKQFASKSVKNLLNANPQLKSLKIVLHNKKDFGPLSKMLDKNVFLSKLKVTGQMKGVNADYLLNRFGKIHPSLSELDLSGAGITVDEAIILGRQLNSLKSLSFQFQSPSECDYVLHQLNSGHWQHNTSQKDKYYTKIVLSH